jgi:hypothetical protein
MEQDSNKRRCCEHHSEDRERVADKQGRAREAFQRQMEEAKGSEYLFPSPRQKSRKPRMTNLLKGWAATLKIAHVPWKESSVMDERMRFVIRLKDGESMASLCREFGISRKDRLQDPGSV